MFLTKIYFSVFVFVFLPMGNHFWHLVLISAYHSYQSHCWWYYQNDVLTFGGYVVCICAYVLHLGGIICMMLSVTAPQ